MAALTPMSYVHGQKQTLAYIYIGTNEQLPESYTNFHHYEITKKMHQTMKAILSSALVNLALVK